MSDDDTTGALPDNNEGESPESHSQSGLKSEIETLKQQNQELMAKFNQFFEAQAQPKHQEKQLSAAEVKSLMDTNPAEAIQYVLKNQVSSQVREVETKLTRQNQVQYFDQKTVQDFPLFEKDAKFKELVKSEVQALVADGMDRDSPKLVYKAAQIAALKYKPQDKSDGSGGASSEAPTNMKRGSATAKNLPSNFDVWAKMFNMNDKAKEKAKESFRQVDERAERRRSSRGGY